MKFTFISMKNMKKSHLFFVFAFCCLAGCAKTTPTQNATQTLNNQITALENSLSDTCKTESVIAQINAIKTQIATVQSVCDTEKAAITAEKVRWQWAFFGLLLVIAAYVGKRIALKLK